MKNSTKILAAAAVLAAAAILLTRKRANGKSLLEDMVETGNDWRNSFLEYASRLRNSLTFGLKGPHGEKVLTDRYDRHYYLDQMNRRVYVENA